MSAGLVASATSAAVDIVEQCPEDLHPQLFPAIAALPQAAVQACTGAPPRMRRLPACMHSCWDIRAATAELGFHQYTCGYRQRGREMQTTPGGCAMRMRPTAAAACGCGHPSLLRCATSGLCICCMLSGPLDVKSDFWLLCRERASDPGC